MKYKVIVKTSLKDRPEDHELSAALILAAYFKTDVVFLRPESRKTPDIDVSGMRWEVKSPKGDGKKTIDNNLRTARKQSHNVLLDLRRTKMHQRKAIARIHFYLTAGPYRFKRLFVITKSDAIIEIL